MDEPLEEIQFAEDGAPERARLAIEQIAPPTEDDFRENPNAYTLTLLLTRPFTEFELNSRVQVPWSVHYTRIELEEDAILVIGTTIDKFRDSAKHIGQYVASLERHARNDEIEHYRKRRAIADHIADIVLKAQSIRFT